MNFLNTKKILVVLVIIQHNTSNVIVGTIEEFQGVPEGAKSQGVPEGANFQGVAYDPCTPLDSPLPVCGRLREGAKKLVP